MLAGQLVDIGAIKPEFTPPNTQPVYHPWPGASRDFGFAVVFASVIEDFDHITA
jgi:hypothetical protein